MPYKMKHFAALISVLLLAACMTPAQTPAPDASTGYNAALAEELGADEYGMRSYVMVVLKTGPAEITDEEQRNEIFRGHFANMTRLAEAGKLVLAGPFMNAGDKRGLYIFNVAEIAEAEALVETDPAVAAGIFTPEYTQYYGSAALMHINDIHSQIQKTKIE